MSLKVIGAGSGRTGTLSLKHALEQPGFDTCYHMLELQHHDGQYVDTYSMARLKLDGRRFLLSTRRYR